jgi:predicted TIM-barrel fold metal-dependent hydrolase
MEIVDAHQHVGSLADAVSFSGQPLGHDLPVEEDAARRIALMDAAGVDWALLQPSHGYLKPDGLRDTMRVNDRMAGYKRIAPTRFRAVVGTLEPMYGERGLPEIDRCKHDLGLDGLSWHHRFQGCFIDSKWMWPILERMHGLKMAPVIHVNADSSIEAHWRLQRLARDFPDMLFLALDGLWSYERARHIFETAAQTPNVIWDIGGPSLYVSVEEWVGRNGSRSICFSADLAYAAGAVKRPELLDRIEQTITDEDRANILHANIRRMFGMAPAD